MILGPKVGVLLSKIVGNDTSVQPAPVEVREWSIHVFSVGIIVCCNLIG